MLVQLLKNTRILPIVVIHDVAHAVPLAQALLDGGMNAIEVTLRTPIAIHAIKAIRAAVPDMIVGVGSIRTPEHIDQVIAAGAHFGVSPALTPKLIDVIKRGYWCASIKKRIHFPLIPGVSTASEALFAFEEGFTHQKLFPAEVVGGINWLKAIGGPLPEILFCPTGGITPDKANEYLAQKNVYAIGGSWLAPDALIQNGDWLAITELAKTALANCETAAS
jgi:2-dehydro-3-deoxyphosphogluconate aldolase/(4S)-4-hydroxy-2-oxoglutarate aldolase